MVNLYGWRLSSHRERKIHNHVFTFSTKRIILSFDVVVLQRMAKKCTKMSNARAEALFSLIKPFVLCRSCCCRRRACLSS